MAFLVDGQSLVVGVHLYRRRKSKVRQGRSRTDDNVPTKTNLYSLID